MPAKKQSKRNFSQLFRGGKPLQLPAECGLGARATKSSSAIEQLCVPKVCPGDLVLYSGTGRPKLLPTQLRQITTKKKQDIEIDRNSLSKYTKGVDKTSQSSDLVVVMFNQQCVNWMHCKRRGSEKSTFWRFSGGF